MYDHASKFRPEVNCYGKLKYKYLQTTDTILSKVAKTVNTFIEKCSYLYKQNYKVVLPQFNIMFLQQLTAIMQTADCYVMVNMPLIKFDENSRLLQAVTSHYIYPLGLLLSIPPLF